MGYLASYGVAIANIDSHERLKEKGRDFFSIHLQRKQFNVRFLVYIDNSGKSFLLSAFNERAGKKGERLFTKDTYIARASQLL